MTRPIEEGDIVTVCWTEGELFKDAKVIHTPFNTGDLWYFEHDGKVYGVNPMCNTFDCIIKKDIENE